MSLEIRRATAADAASVLSLWRTPDVEPSHTDDVAGIVKLIERDPGALMVAVDDTGEVVGSIVAGWDGWRGSIYRLAVAPARRRQGLGRRLVSAAEERLREVGAVRCQAIVVESTHAAMSFWSACGWELQPDRVRYVKG